MSDQPDNIPAGTQVVSSVPIRGSNDALIHPCGAVGIITRTPSGEGNHYLVRFPDGFAILLTREEFDVLKHFKDRFLGAASASTDSPEFDLDQFVIYASKQNADGCWPSSAASYRGTRRKHGA
jgi:hypothetical protein